MSQDLIITYSMTPTPPEQVQVCTFSMTPPTYSVMPTLTERQQLEDTLTERGYPFYNKETVFDPVLDRVTTKYTRLPMEILYKRVESTDPALVPRIVRKIFGLSNCPISFIQSLFDSYIDPDSLLPGSLQETAFFWYQHFKTAPEFFNIADTF